MSRARLTFGLALSAIAAIFLVPRLADRFSHASIPPVAPEFAPGDLRIDARISRSTHQVHSLELELGFPATSSGVDIVVVLDASGSMIASDDPSQPSVSKFDHASRAIAALSSSLGPMDSLAIVTFADDATVVHPFQSCGDLDTALRTVRLGGGSNLYAGLNTGLSLLSTTHQGECGRRAVSHGPTSQQLILLSDGRANVGNTDPNQIRALLDAYPDVRVATHGLGSDPDAHLLAELAERGHGSWAKVDQVSNLHLERLPLDGSTTFAKNVTIEVQDPHLSLLTASAGGPYTFSLGDIRGNQQFSYNFTFDGPPHPIRLRVTYQDAQGRWREAVNTAELPVTVHQPGISTPWYEQSQ